MGAYGGSGISASASNASVSLLTSGTAKDGSGNYYVATGSDGSFTISGDYTCTAGQQVYVYSVGGDPGLGTGVNTAAGLMAVLGSCPTGGNFLSGTTPISYVVVNEVSTVAAAYAMAGFATDATHVGSSGTTLALTGIANAFANAANLETLGTGVALATTPAGNGTVPQAEINTLANILASCVNSNGAGSACSTLFANAESGGTTGTMAADTATAAINIAHNPGAGIAALYGLSTATPPFAGGLTKQPNDFVVAIELSGGGLDNAIAVAVDSLGDAWVTNSIGNSVSEFSSTGAALSPSTGYTGGGLSRPSVVAIDTSGNVWVMNADQTYGGVTELSNSGSVLRNLNTTQPYNILGCMGGEATGMSVDASGSVWVVLSEGSGSACVVKVSSTGQILSGTSGYAGGGVTFPSSVAIDGSENAWVAGPAMYEFSNTGSVLSGASGYTNGTVYAAYGIAVDASGSVWGAYNTGSLRVPGGLVKLSNAGSYVSGANGYTGGGFWGPEEAAIDGAGNVWVADAGSPYASTESFGGVSEFSNSGLPISGANGYMGAGFYDSPYNFPAAVAYPSGIAIDGSGDVWVGNQYGYPSFLTEFIGAGTPVITPIAAGLPATPTADGSSKLGTRP